MKRFSIGFIIISTMLAYISLPIIINSDNSIANYYRANNSSFDEAEYYLTYPIYKVLSRSQFLKHQYCIFADNFCDSTEIQIKIILHELNFPPLVSPSNSIPDPSLLEGFEEIKIEDYQNQ